MKHLKRKQVVTCSRAGEIYFVVPHGNWAWHISFDGKLFGPWDTQDEAIAVAVDEARIAAETGKSTEVMVQESDQVFRSYWTPRKTRRTTTTN